MYGVDGMEIAVEADVSDGLPVFSLVGYLSSSVKEAGERVRTAIKNSGYRLPPKRITINLSPADTKKDGSGFDLPIACAVLSACGNAPAHPLDHTMIIGELGLDGSVKPVPGVLPMLFHAAKNGVTQCIVPKGNVNEAALVRDLSVIGVESLSETMRFLLGQAEITPVSNLCETLYKNDLPEPLDFADVRGQESLKRGMEIAVAGFHNVLMTGAAGAGKSMLAKRLPSIMPRLSMEESIEVTKLYSVRGLLKDSCALVTRRPFRAPHHTVSSQALVGGGLIPRPGEVSLAHNGVLFLDELPEFNKNVLEVLRQPLEDRAVMICRVGGTFTFPADFMLVCAMNPCPCGNYPDLNRCQCSPLMIRRYQGRVSGPLLDRIDINMEVKPLGREELFSGKTGESSESIRARVERARRIQEKRYAEDGIHFNSQLSGNLIQKYISIDSSCETLLAESFRKNGLSARGIHRILKLSRTIADLEESPDILAKHLQEAIFFRNSGLGVQN